MTRQPEQDLPLDLPVADAMHARRRRRFDRRFLLVLLIPVFMFTGAVLGMYFQPRGLQMF